MITKALLKAASARNSRMPDDERWSRLVTRAGRLARKVTRDGITASELRDEKPRKAIEFGSELPVCKRHGAKGSTKTLPGKFPGRDFATAYRDMMIKQGVIRAKVIKGAVQVAANPVIKPDCIITRMLTATGK